MENNNKKLFNIETAEKMQEKTIFDGEDYSEFIVECFKSFYRYIEVVDAGETQIKVACFREDQSDYIKIAQEYNASRSRAHEAAISRVKALNRLSLRMLGEKVFLGDETNRWEIADFCLEATNHTFQNRKL